MTSTKKDWVPTDDGDDGDIVFKDSLCFFQMPLAAFPKAFGLTEHKKGFFPHFFNTPDHQDYVGPLPDKSHYDPEGMSIQRAQDFHQWYDAHEPGFVFDFQKELVAYCESDVLLLKGACQVFCQEFEQILGSTPSNDVSPSPRPATSSTAPSTCPNAAWPRNPSVDGTLKANPIPSRPWNG